MRLNIDEVRRIASLARLELSAEEEELFTAQLGEIVGYFDQLQGFETAAASPAEPPVPEAADAEAPCLDRDRFLANAPQTFEGFLVVPQVKVTRGEVDEP